MLKGTLIKLVGIPLLALLGYQAYDSLIKPPEKLDFYREAVVNQVCQESVDEIRLDPNIQRIILVPLQGDVTGRVTEIMTEKVSQSGKFKIGAERSFLQKLFGEYKVDQSKITIAKSAAEAGRKLGVDAVLFGEIVKFTGDPNSGAEIELNIRIVNTKTEEGIFVGNYHKKIEKNLCSLNYLHARIINISPGWRLFTWVIFVFLLPLITFFLIKYVISFESNTINFLMLVGYTIVDLLLALFLLGISVPNIWIGLMLTGALSLSGLYNYWISTRIEELTK